MVTLLEFDVAAASAGRGGSAGLTDELSSGDVCEVGPDTGVTCIFCNDGLVGVGEVRISVSVTLRRGRLRS